VLLHGRDGDEMLTITLAVAIPAVKARAPTWRNRPCGNKKAMRKTVRLRCASVTLQKQANKWDIAHQESKLWFVHSAISSIQTGNERILDFRAPLTTFSKTLQRDFFSGTTAATSPLETIK
jgi:hypothetical protein